MRKRGESHRSSLSKATMAVIRRAPSRSPAMKAASWMAWGVGARRSWTKEREEEKEKTEKEEKEGREKEGK